MSDGLIKSANLKRFSLYGEAKGNARSPCMLFSVTGNSMFNVRVFINAENYDDNKMLRHTFYTQELYMALPKIESLLSENTDPFQLGVEHTKYGFKDGRVDTSTSVKGTFWVCRNKDGVCFLLLELPNSPKVGFKFEIMSKSNYILNKKELNTNEMSADMMLSWLHRLCDSLNTVHDAFEVKEFKEFGDSKTVVDTSGSASFDDDIPF